MTQRIREGGSLLGIELLDHIIIGDNCYVSLAEQKLLKEKVVWKGTLDYGAKYLRS